MPLEWLFGHRMTPDEMLRKNQRALNKAMRDLDRENMRMEQQEKKIIVDVKKMAKDGQMVSAPVYSSFVPVGYGRDRRDGFRVATIGRSIVLMIERSCWQRTF